MATFCLIHGAWHDRSCWDPLLPYLAERGHDAVAPDLPLDDPEAGFEERIQPALRAIANVGGPVVIVGHSQGTAYSSLVAAARPASLLVHLCPRLGGFEPPLGAPATFRPGVPFPANRPDGTSVWDPETAIVSMYRRLPPETARSLAHRLRPMAPAPGEYPLGAHPANPTVLVYAAEDELFEPSWERFMAHELLGVEPIEFPGGHFPMLEDPERLGMLLDRLCRERAPNQAASQPTHSRSSPRT
jgi:pimeloyl-ACP methyl ester carboxylesterase